MHEVASCVIREEVEIVLGMFMVPAYLLNKNTKARKEDTKGMHAILRSTMGQFLDLSTVCILHCSRTTQVHMKKHMYSLQNLIHFKESAAKTHA